MAAAGVRHPITSASPAPDVAARAYAADLRCESRTDAGPARSSSLTRSRDCRGWHRRRLRRPRRPRRSSARWSRPAAHAVARTRARHDRQQTPQGRRIAQAARSILGRPEATSRSEQIGPRLTWPSAGEQSLGDDLLELLSRQTAGGDFRSGRGNRRSGAEGRRQGWRVDLRRVDRPAPPAVGRAGRRHRRARRPRSPAPSWCCSSLQICFPGPQRPVATGATPRPCASSPATSGKDRRRGGEMAGGPEGEAHAPDVDRARRQAAGRPSAHRRKPAAARAAREQLADSTTNRRPLKSSHTASPPAAPRSAPSAAAPRPSARRSRCPTPGRTAPVAPRRAPSR